MNRAKLCAVIYLVAAIFGYINTFASFRNPDSSSGGMWLVIALILTGLSAFYFLKRGR